MQIIKAPWKNYFLKSIAEAKHSVRMTSPFVKYNICKELLKAKNERASLELITSFKLVNAYNGALDLSGLELLLKQGGVIKNYPKLHSKIYIFDEKKAIISSGNLTNGGLTNNFEYGVLIDEKDTVQEIIYDFNSLSLDSITGIIKLSHINKANDLLSKINNAKNIRTSETDFNIPESIRNELYNIKPQILSSLKGWKREVFECIDKTNSQKFTLEEIYVFEDYLKKVYPENLNVKAKIRQQIQFLRDLGLIEFLNKGEYLKLWN